MSRSKHTRPRDIIAANRILDPRGRRGAGDPKFQRRFLRELKEIGIDFDGQGATDVTASASDALPEATTAATRLPRVSEQRARPRFFHPASSKEVRLILTRVGEISWYGVQEVCLVHRRPHSGELAAFLFLAESSFMNSQNRPGSCPATLSGHRQT